jgi:hypothetical protein
MVSPSDHHPNELQQGLTAEAIYQWMTDNGHLETSAEHGR